MEQTATNTPSAVPRARRTLFGRARTDAWLGTARALVALEGHGFKAVHDRRASSVRASIDHIAVGPSGMFVIETQSFPGRLQIQDGELVIGGRRRTQIVEQTLRKTDAVRRALTMDIERTRVPLVPILCMHRAVLPWGMLALKGVRVVSTHEMAHVIRNGEFLLHPDEVDRLARALDEGLPPA